MKSFIWRLRRSAPWFLGALAIFTIIYIVYACMGVSIIERQHEYNGIKWTTYRIICLSAIDPTIIAAVIGFAFFMVHTKRFSYDEEFFYGHSRKYAYLASQTVGIVYSFIFALYTVGLALLVRRGVIIANDVLVPSEIYYISVGEVFCNFILMFVAQMLAFEFAVTLRKFKSWKFWLTIICYTITVLILVWVLILIPLMGSDFHYWQSFFAALVPQVFIMAIGDFFMTRGRQYR